MKSRIHENKPGATVVGWRAKWGKSLGKVRGFRLQGMLVLLPGLLLAAWGTVNLCRDSTAAAADTRMQMHTATELVQSRLGELMEARRKDGRVN